MKVSISWLKELVKLDNSIQQVEHLLPLRTIGTKEIDENFFELDMKGYNRSDLLSMRGVAYEIAAITDATVTFSETLDQDFIWSNKNLPQVNVEVLDPDLVPVYAIAKIEGLEVQNTPSNSDSAKQLTDCGMRAINNVVDVTNLVMLEYGQPLHAFDAKSVQDEKIIVRLAHPQEKLTTLDHKERVLEKTDLLICDPAKALGVAGVMGGANSEISDSPCTILLEAAIFDPVNIRQTSQRLGLPSEASKRFQHGLTKTRLLQALDAAIRHYQDLGGKLTALTIVTNFEDQIKQVHLSQTKANSLIGVTISNQQIEDYLAKLHFQLQATSADSWEITVPYWRLDIKIEEDLIEEVARMYGYENIPAESLPNLKLNTLDQTDFRKIDQLRQEIITQGLAEIMTYSYFTSEVINNLHINQDSLVKIANPMSAQTEYLRTRLWPNLLEKAAENLKERDSLAIFEIGKTYHPQNQGVPKEKKTLGILLVNQTNNPLAELITIIKQIPSLVDLTVEQISADKNFHPQRYLQIKNNRGEVIGLAGEIHPRVVNQFGAEKRIAIMEISLDD
ncbi:MAG: phenylalanine--tRNA ligase subunit beta [Patescibacteria group bacterium]|nr:phenylalanine--tRNA ligase subunit beta [Patescibacteria group bacterium]